MICASVQIKTIFFTDHGRITIRQDVVFAVCNNDVVDIRLLSRFDQQFLQLKSIILYIYRSAKSGFEGAD